MSYKIECILPILNVKDISKSVAFYSEMLGFQPAAWGDESFTSITCGNCSVFLCRGGQGHPGTWIWIGIDGDIFALYENLQAKGVKVVLPPSNYSWALEMGIEDPDGHILRLGTDNDPALPYADKMP